MRVSFLISVYNGEATIGRAINSCLNQDFCDFEIIIVDDGSTDNTREIIHDFKDPRIKYYHHDNQGIAKSLNVGLKLAKGDYIAKIDADDENLDFRLSTQVEFLDKNLDYVVCGSFANLVSGKGNFLKVERVPVDYTDIKDSIEFRNCFIHSTTMYRREVAVNVLYDEVLNIDFEDWLFFKNVLRFGKGCNIPISLVNYYTNPFSISSYRFNNFEKEIRKRIISRGYALEEEVTSLRKRDISKTYKYLKYVFFVLFHLFLNLDFKGIRKFLFIR